MAKPCTHDYKDQIAAELGELKPQCPKEYRNRFIKGFKYTHCLRGHELTDDNLYTTPGGNRVCRTCARIRAKYYQRKRYQDDPIRFSRERDDYSLKHKYGMTREEKNRMLLSQNSRCGNKGCLAENPYRSEKRSGWLVDHDHSTGKVRGLLCNICNLVLGMLEDDPDKLRGLINYLEEHKNRG